MSGPNIKPCPLLGCHDRCVNAQAFSLPLCKQCIAEAVDRAIRGVLDGVLHGIPNIPLSKGQYPNIPNSREQYPNIPFSNYQDINFLKANIPNSPRISQYPSFREAISQYPRKNDQYPNIPDWSNTPCNWYYLSVSVLIYTVGPLSQRSWRRGILNYPSSVFLSIRLK